MTQIPLTQSRERVIFSLPSFFRGQRSTLGPPCWHFLGKQLPDFECRLASGSFSGDIFAERDLLTSTAA